MPSYYLDGVRYSVDASRSTARFHLNAIGVPVVHGTLPVRGGELVIDTTDGIRTANFQLEAKGLALEGPLPFGSDPRGLLGSDAHPVIEFETQWAREGKLDHHELDGLLRLHGQEHVFSLRAQRGAWEPQDATHWYRGTLSGGLDRKSWEVRRHTLVDAGLLLLGHEVHFEVMLVAGPRVQAEAQPG
jgi:polyisoprenoid-binding protein YceI